MNGKREQFITLVVHNTTIRCEYVKSQLNISQGLSIRHVVFEHEGAKCREDVERPSNDLGKSVLKLCTSEVQCAPYSTRCDKECNRKSNMKQTLPRPDVGETRWNI